MSDFGTGLRAHLESTRNAPAFVVEPSVAVVAADASAAEEQRRLEALAVELAGREFQLAQREADLAAEHEQMALALARILLEQARIPALRPAAPDAPADELAELRARRYGRAS